MLKVICIYQEYNKNMKLTMLFNQLTASTAAACQKQPAAVTPALENSQQITYFHVYWLLIVI